MSGVGEGYVSVRGVRLHYLDWGGSGPPLVFLAGFGNTPHFFDSVAHRLSDRFRVLGLTRRGHGRSDQPQVGYDVATLAEDIVGFLDELSIPCASFAGHSFAGCEMIQLAIAHSSRVAKLVFLDALYGIDEKDLAILSTDPLRAASPPPETFDSAHAYAADFTTRYPQYRKLRSPRWDALLALSLERAPDGRFRECLRPESARQLWDERLRFRADWREIHCPVLAVYAFQDGAWSVPDGASPGLREVARIYYERVERDRTRRYMTEAREAIRGVRILELPGTSHYCFLDREDAVVDAMRAFL